MVQCQSLHAMRLANEETKEGVASFGKEPAATFRTKVHEAGAASVESTPFSLNSGRVAILTGGGDKPYALGLASSLISQGVAFDFIGSDALDVPELRRSPLVRFLNLRNNMRPDVCTAKKIWRVLIY